MVTRLIISLGICAASVSAFADSQLDQWIIQETAIAKERLLLNVSPAPRKKNEVVLKGAILASPQDNDPDYYFHWTRDAALVADVMISMYERETSPAQKAVLLQNVLDYANFSSVSQKTPTYAGLGEPKFYVSGEAFLGPWGRPQNDGPALRASALLRLGKILMNSGYNAYFFEKIWPVIRDDLEYVSHVWSLPNFDLWEEVKADHFYTRMVQRRALEEGAIFASQIDPGFSAWLKTQSDLLALRLDEHFTADTKRIVENINLVEGIGYKHSGLDTATLLAVLHTKRTPWMAFSNEYLANSAASLEKSFAAMYPINSHRRDLGTAIGRYPEDHYYGGNPWFLTTLAFAEYNYELGLENFKAGRKLEASKYLERGDNYLRRVQAHMDQTTGSMAEQMRRDSGYMTSARDLTWSYAAWLTAAWSRENLGRQL